MKTKKRKTMLERVEMCERRFDKCPFCGEGPRIGIHDEEGNFKGFAEDDRAREYIEDPWSGLSFQIWHPVEFCVVGTEDPRESCGFGGYRRSYDTPEDAVSDWNDRSAAVDPEDDAKEEMA